MAVEASNAQTGRSGGTLLIHGESTMASLLRTHDWVQSPLGAIETWSETLVAATNLVLSSPFPTAIFWGEAYTLLYNDAHMKLTSTKHPASLGQSGQDVWKEAWHLIGPLYEGALHRGETS